LAAFVDMNSKCKCHIALVEENATTSLLLKDFLELSNHQVFSLPTDWPAASAWLALASAAPDLIVLDLQHPSMTGLAWLRHLRTSRWRQTPVIATSVSLSRHTQLLLNTLGVHHCLVKPFCLESLKQEIDEQLAKSVHSEPLHPFWDTPVLRPNCLDVQMSQG